MATKDYQCENCKLRANYDKNPKSFMGRFWHYLKQFIIAEAITVLFFMARKTEWLKIKDHIPNYQNML